MSREFDIAIRAQTDSDWLNAAGLVFEWIGYPRWIVSNGDEANEPTEAILIDRAEAANLRRIPTCRPALVELTTDRGIDLPCDIAYMPELRDRMHTLHGLYSHLENYNGIRGIREPLTVPVPKRHSRATTRRQGDESDPSPLPDDPPCFALPEGGEVIVHTNGGAALVTRREHQVFLGLPIISILARHLTAPVMDRDTYLFSEPVHHLIAILEYCVDLIAPPGTCRVAPWPHDARGAFALRHDYDRPTDIIRVVERECQLKIPPTVHVLADQLPSREEIEAIHGAFGEVALHGRWLDQIAQERRRVAQVSGTDSIGHSAHGGREADGWRGLHNLLAAHHAQVEYTELLSEMHLWPHRIPDMTGGPGAALHPLAMPHHLSFDVDMRNEDGDRLSREVGAVFANRGLFTLMNHPDIHVDALMHFLADYIPRDVPRMTLIDVTRWWKATHTQQCLQISTTVAPSERMVCVQGKATPDQVGLVIEVTLPTDWKAGKLSLSAVDHATLVFGCSPRLRFTLSEESADGFLVETGE